MYKLINGWTKEKVMEQVKKYNNNTKAKNKIACVYLAPNGNRCAIGCFIPDGHPALTATSCAASELVNEYPDLKTVMPFRASELDDFQVAHDRTGNPAWDSENNFWSPSNSVYDNIALFLDRLVE
jgi:hypothetical protein